MVSGLSWFPDTTVSSDVLRHPGLILKESGNTVLSVQNPWRRIEIIVTAL
jgi:hypothetical protein